MQPYFFLQFLVIETLDPDPYPDPDSFEMLDPNPQHCFLACGTFSLELDCSPT
jgi:hypothetical protein